LKWTWDAADKKFARILYAPGKRWMSFQHRLGHRREVSADAKQLAQELGEGGRARFYQQILDGVDPECVNEAVKDLRALAATRRMPDNRAAWFLGALKQILERRGEALFPQAEEG
jgi:hypothetical protein